MKISKPNVNQMALGNQPEHNEKLSDKAKNNTPAFILRKMKHFQPMMLSQKDFIATNKARIQVFDEKNTFLHSGSKSDKRVIWKDKAGFFIAGTGNAHVKLEPYEQNESVEKQPQ
ncbi:hypothetical protein MASR2M12_00030 [Bacteroidales bacterium]